MRNLNTQIAEVFSSNGQRDRASYRSELDALFASLDWNGRVSAWKGFARYVAETEGFSPEDIGQVAHALGIAREYE